MNVAAYAPEIFLSYRSTDAGDAVRNLHTELLKIFDPASRDRMVVYMDKERREPDKVGPFDAALSSALDAAHLVIPIIGPGWASNRLCNPEDWVRKEIQAALAPEQARSKRLLPIYMNGGALPDEAMMRDWPTDAQLFIKALRREHGVVLRSHSDMFGDDLERVVRRILMLLRPDSRARRAALTSTRGPAQRIVVGYDLAGFAAALIDNLAEWKGAALFSSIASELLMDLRSCFFDRLRNTKLKFHWLPGSTGGTFVVDANVPAEQAMARVADLCLDVQDDFSSVLGGYAKDDGRGVNWSVDLRIAATTSDLTWTSSAIRHDEIEVYVGGEAASFVGPAMNVVSAMLALEDDDGMPTVGRGTVVIIPQRGWNVPAGYDSEPVETHERDCLQSYMSGADELEDLWRGRRRKPVLTYIRITDATVGELRRRTLAPPDKIDDLPFHQPPQNYATDILKRANAKNAPRICVLVGEPGTGKTLCALRVVAELMLLGNLTVQMPPVTSETWKLLPLQTDSGRVIFLDDAFGRIEASDHLDLDQAVLAFDPEREGFLAEATDGRPILIITLREQIWEIVQKSHPPLAKLLKPFIVEFKRGTGPDSAYDKDLIQHIFDGYWRKAVDAKKAVIEGSYHTLQTAVRNHIDHPLSIRDLVDEYSERGAQEALLHIDAFQKDALSRYTHELETCAEPNFVFLALVHAFASSFLDEEELTVLYSAIGRRLGWAVRDDAKANWIDLPARARSWGEWHRNGHYEFKHPLREEAMRAVFLKKEDKPELDRMFDALLQMPEEAVLKNYSGISLAAFAAPRFGCSVRKGSARHKCLEEVMRTPNGDASLRLARSLGQMFPTLVHIEQQEATDTGATIAPSAPKKSWWGRPEASTVAMTHLAGECMEKFLESHEAGSFGAAFTAFCDSYGPVTSKLLGKSRSKASKSLEAAIAGVRNDRRRGADEFDPSNRATAVVEQAAWAIACNFERMPDEFKEALVVLVGESSASLWLRLRSIEAVADYFSAIPKNSKYRELFSSAITGSVNQRVHDLARRGVAGAIEANLEQLDGAARLLGWVEDSTEWNRFAFIEWVIWACGNNLEDLLKADKKRRVKKDESRLIDAFEKLARHEDARVRKWLATALSEAEDQTRQNERLLALLSRLANDRDEVVRDVSVKFFLSNQD